MRSTHIIMRVILHLLCIVGVNFRYVIFSSFLFSFCQRTWDFIITRHLNRISELILHTLAQSSTYRRFLSDQGLVFVYSWEWMKNFLFYAVSQLVFLNIALLLKDLISSFILRDSTVAVFWLIYKLIKIVAISRTNLHAHVFFLSVKNHFSPIVRFYLLCPKIF